MATKKKSARSKQRRQKSIFYVARIKEWSWDYSFGINNTPKWIVGPYQDYRHLNVSGELLRPSGMSSVEVALTFVPTRNLRDAKYQTNPDNVGRFDWERGSTDLNGHLSLPEDVLSSLLPMLIANRYEFLTLESFDLFRGQALIRSYHFPATLDPADFPPE
jgi:hypothetical protein